MERNKRLWINRNNNSNCELWKHVVMEEIFSLFMKSQHPFPWHFRWDSVELLVFNVERNIQQLNLKNKIEWKNKRNIIKLNRISENKCHWITESLNQLLISHLLDEHGFLLLLMLSFIRRFSTVTSQNLRNEQEKNREKGVFQSRNIASLISISLKLFLVFFPSTTTQILLYSDADLSYVNKHSTQKSAKNEREVSSIIRLWVLGTEINIWKHNSTLDDEITILKIYLTNIYANCKTKILKIYWYQSELNWLPLTSDFDTMKQFMKTNLCTINQTRKISKIILLSDIGDTQIGTKWIYVL